jgi:hypothetical protein
MLSIKLEQVIGIANSMEQWCNDKTAEFWCYISLKYLKELLK